MHLQKGHSNNQMGCVRVITIDGHQFLEQLEGLDDVDHTQYVPSFLKAVCLRKLELCIKRRLREADLLPS